MGLQVTLPPPRRRRRRLPRLPVPRVVATATTTPRHGLSRHRHKRPHKRVPIQAGSLERFLRDYSSSSYRRFACSTKARLQCFRCTWQPSSRSASSSAPRPRIRATTFCCSERCFVASVTTASSSSTRSSYRYCRRCSNGSTGYSTARTPR